MTNEAIEILLVEDDPNDVELTVRALRGRNLANRVHVISDGAEALEYIQDVMAADAAPALPKVVFLDLKLPKVSGLEILQAMKSAETTRRIPVVVLTSSNEERDLMMSYNLGANSYIVKPVDFDQFVRSIEDIGLYWLVLNRPPVVAEAKTP